MKPAHAGAVAEIRGTSGSVAGMGHRLIKAGLIGAGALTVTWWTLLAAGVWQAIGWAVA